MTRYLVTSALPYINGVKHLGTLAGSLLSADVYARFRRAQGFETLAICATDEHGSTTELAAQEAGMGVREFCDQQFALQKKAGEGFELGWDHFGRSSNRAQPRVDAAFRPRSLEERASGSAHDQAGLFQCRRTVSSRPLCDRHLSALRL